MDGCMYRAPNDPTPIVASATCIDATAKGPEDAAPGVAWLSVRSGYWPPPGRGEAPGDSPGWWEADAWRGVACLMLGVGAGGAGWLARLARSRWFAGLEPRAEDLAPGDVARGGWATPAGVARGVDRVAADAGASFASAPLPRAWYAAVAVPRGAGPAERSAALGAVDALRGRRDPLGRRLAVVATVDAPASLDGAFVRGLLDRGAFVVRGGLGAAGDHLHHVPLRAPVQPRRGRLICVDLADWLHTWRPGRVAELHAIPSAFDAAVQALRRVPVPAGGARALNLVFHLDPDAIYRGVPGDWLRGVERLAGHCRGLFLGPDGDMVFTDADRLDGRTGSADLLVVRGGDR